MSQWLVSAGLGFLAKLILGWLQQKNTEKTLRKEGFDTAERTGRDVVEEIANEQDQLIASRAPPSRDAIVERLRQRW